MKLNRILAILICVVVAACGDTTAPVPEEETGVLTGQWDLKDDYGKFRAVFTLKDTTLSAHSMQDTVSRWMAVFAGRDTIVVDGIATGKGTFYAKGAQGPARCVAMRFHNWLRGHPEQEAATAVHRFRLQCAGTVSGMPYTIDTNAILDPSPGELTEVGQLFINADAWPQPFLSFVAYLTRTP